MTTSLDKQAAETAVLIGKFLGECFKLRGLPRVVKDLELIMPTMQLLIEEQFQAFATQGREQSKWVSVAERLPPPPHRQEWYWVTDGELYDVAIMVHGGFIGHRELKVTHWQNIQPLPAPPETTEQEER